MPRVSVAFALGSSTQEVIDDDDFLLDVDDNFLLDDDDNDDCNDAVFDESDCDVVMVMMH